MGNLLFFGAGASYGTDKVFPESPPLGKNLYPKLAHAFQNTWGELPAPVASIFENNFEDGMEALWLNYSSSVPILIQNMACFFAQFKLDGSKEDFYSKIINYLNDSGKLDEYAFSTINYECLIEDAFIRLGRNVSYGPELVNNPNVSTLWKLHGSCNFVVKGIKAQAGNVSYTSGTLFHGSGIELIAQSQVPEYCKSSALYPCMSLYAPGKPNQMARSNIESMQRNWQIHLSEADKIIIIGSNPHPPDTHIWEHLSNCTGHIYYIGNRDIFLDWAKENKKDNTYTYMGDKLARSYEQLMDIL